MHELAFADAARPTPSTILKVPLLPYSIGHELLLLAGRNALLMEPEIAASLPLFHQRSAIISAVMVCSRKWVNRNTRERWKRVWAWTIRKADFRAAQAEFRLYRAAGSTAPPTASDQDDKESRSLGAPGLGLILNHALSLVGESGYDMPLGLARWLYYSDCEVKGYLKIQNHFEEQMEAEFSQHLADYEREQREAKEAACHH